MKTSMRMVLGHFKLVVSRHNKLNSLTTCSNTKAGHQSTGMGRRNNTKLSKKY
jgi:hypothetical protein